MALPACIQFHFGSHHLCTAICAITGLLYCILPLLVYKMSGKCKNESADTSNRKYNSHKVKIIGTNLEITRCAENNKSLGSIGSSLDSSQLPVTSTVKTNKKIKEHA